jgi:8-oxo-dGTP diphosphatase
MTHATMAVAAVIADPAGRVLLCQQSQGHRLWGLPGGKIRDGESPVHAAIRDIQQEIGNDIQIVDLVGLYQLTGNGSGDDLPDLVTHVFRATLSGEATLNAPGRICRLGWHDTTTLPEPMTATTRAALADAVDGRSGAVREVRRDAEPALPDADLDEPELSPVP